MKKSCLFLCAFMLTCTLAACQTTSQTAVADAPANASAQPAADAEPMQMLVSMSSFDNTFVSFIMSYMKSYDEYHPELEITFMDASNDAATQISQIEQAIIGGTQAVICLCVDAKQTQPIVTACRDADVPLVALNREFSGGDCFVGADNASAGRMVAERCAQLLGEKGNVALVQGILGQPNTYERTDAIVQTFAEKYPEMKIVLDGAADWKRDKALILVETWLQSGTTFDAVICLNDDAALGAQMALDSAGLADQVPVLSINGDPSGLQGVKDGLLNCTAFQAPFRKAEQALVAAAQLIQGQSVPARIIVDYELVTADNVDSYMQFAKAS